MAPSLLGDALAVDRSGQLLAAWQSATDQLSVCNLREGGIHQVLAWPESGNSQPSTRDWGGQLFSSDLVWSPQGDCLAVLDRRRRTPEPTYLVLWHNETPDDPLLLAAVLRDPHLGGPCFHPQKNQVAFATGPREITVWDTVTGERVDTVPLPRPLAGRTAWHPNGRYLACPCAGDTSSRVALAPTTSHPLAGDSNASIPPQRPNPGTGDAQTFESDSSAQHSCRRPQRRDRPCTGEHSAGGLTQGRPCQVQPPPENAGTGHVRASAGNASSTHEVLVWDLEQRRLASRREVNDDLRGSVLAYHPQGTMLAVGTRMGDILLWEEPSGQQLAKHPMAHAFGISVLGWSEDGRQLLSWGILEGLLKCWDVAGPPLDEEQFGRQCGPFALSPDGRWFAVSIDGGAWIQILDRKSNRFHRQLLGNSDAPRTILIFGRDSRQLAQIDADRAVAWDVQSGQMLARLESAIRLDGEIASVAFTETGDLLAAVERTQSPRIAVWDVLRGREVWRSTDAIADLDLAFLVPPGRYLAGIRRSPVGPQTELHVVDLATNQLVTQRDLPGRPMDWQSFSPDGHWMASVRFLEGDPMFAVLGTTGNVMARAEVVLFAMPSCREGETMSGPSAPTTSCFAPDSDLLAIGYREGIVQLYTVPDAQMLFESQLTPHGIRQLAFSGDGTTLVIRDEQGTVRFLRLGELRASLADLELQWE